MKKKSKRVFVLPVILTLIVLAVNAVGIIAVHRWLDVQSCAKVDPETDHPVQSSQSQESSNIDEAEILENRIDQIVGQMSVEQKVGLMFLLRADDSNKFLNLLSEINAGGVVFFAKDFKNKSPDEVVAMTARMQAASDGRMFMAVDEEGGTVVRLSSNPKLRSEKFKSPSEIFSAGGMSAIESDTVDKCEFLRRFGLNMNFAPVADVCTDPKGFMYKRAFQREAWLTAEYVSTVVKSMKENGVMSCVKHFPGYGDSKGDTHNGLDVNEKDLSDLKSVDLLPFERAIEDGVDCIMVTHTIINAIDREKPASLSSKVIGMIREEYGFDGLIISDGMDMGAIIEFTGNSGQACIDAILAGNDLICVPKNALNDYKAVLSAIETGEISEQRIDESVRRIVRAKIEYGFYD